MAQKTVLRGLKIPFTIGRWKGIDGAELICALDCGSYVHNFKDDDLTRDNDLIQRVERDPMRTAYRYFGAGDRGDRQCLSPLWQ